jgi:co-chaperonin GroES (HSP10)
MRIQSTDARSAELSQSCNTYVAEGEQIRMRLDYLLVEPLDRDLSKVLQVVERTKPVRGRVIAAGPGTHPKVYDHPDKHKLKSFEYSSRFLETQVKPGDLVELGGIDIGGYSFPQIMYGDKKYLICRELDVSGVLEQ